MTSFDGSIKCTILFHSRDYYLAVVANEVSRMHQALFRLMGVHCHRNMWI